MRLVLDLPDARSLTAEEFAALPEAVFLKPLTDPKRSQFSAADVRCVVEVISPESVARDRIAKPPRYAAAGIQEFWLVEEHPDEPFDALVRQFELTPAETYALVRTVTLTTLEEGGL